MRHAKSYRKLFFLLLPAAVMAACNNNGATTPVYTTASDTSAHDLVSTSRGKELFEQRCAACHGVYGNAKKEDAANLQLSRLDSIGIIHVVENGRGLMPMFKDAMPDSDLAYLEVYVKNLRKN